MEENKKKMDEIISKLALTFYEAMAYSYAHSYLNGKRISPRIDKMISKLKEIIKEYKNLREMELKTVV